MKAVLSAYGKANLPGNYTVTRRRGAIDVVPAQILGADGSMRDVTPVMSRTISLPLEKRASVATLMLIAAKLSQAVGVKVVLLTQPFNEGDTVTFGAPLESADDVISDPVLKFWGKMSFQLPYDIPGKLYYLRVGFPHVAASPAEPPPQASLATQPGNEFFIKAPPRPQQQPKIH